MSSTSGFILILIGFGFLIFVHELGHFLAAKWAGIRADGFAIGMGPCVASYRKGVGFTLGSADAIVMRRHGKRPLAMADGERLELGLGETEYSLRALPVGGFVRMLGQEDGDPGATSDDARSFSKAAIPKRAVVILAGITANLILAIVLFLVAFLVGVRFPAPLIGFVAPSGAAAMAVSSDASAPKGLQAGDRVVDINGDEIKTFVDMRVATAMARPDEPLHIEVERDGKRVSYTTTPTKEPDSGLLSLGVGPAHSATLTDVAESSEEVLRALNGASESLVRAGVGPGWRICAANCAAITNYAQLAAMAASSDGAPMTLSWTTRPITETEPAEPTNTNVDLSPTPNFEVLVSTASEGSSERAVDVGLLGLAPLARVREVVESSKNKGILRSGDVFLRVGSLVGPRTSEAMRLFRAAPGATIPALVLRDGAETAVELKTDSEGRVGVYLESALDLPLLARCVEQTLPANALGQTTDSQAFDTPAKALDAMPLGTIVSVNGEAITNFITLRSALMTIARAAASATPPSTNVSVRLGLRDPSPNAAAIEVPLTLDARALSTLTSLGYTFPIPEAVFDPEFTVLSADGDPLRAIAMGFRQTIVMVKQVFLTIDRVSRGSVGVEQLQGPVGILHTGTQVASEGFMFMVFFLALISVNLAVVNLLPIPIADGGLFMFLLYERFVGRPPSIAFQNAAALAGIAFVAGLFLLTFYNDIGRIFG